MTRDNQQYESNFLASWWTHSSVGFKIILAILPTTFCAGVIYATLVNKVDAYEPRIASLETKQEVDHEMLTRVDQGVADLKLYWDVPSYHGGHK